MWFINKVVKSYLDKQFDSQGQIEQNTDKDIRYFKLPYIGKYSKIAKERINTMIKKHCKDIDIRLIFTTSKIKDSFSTKDKFKAFSRTSKFIYKFV